MKFKIWIATILLILIATATVFLVSLQGRGTNLYTEGPAAEKLEFPKDFYWGASIAGEQAETLQASDWATFEQDAFLHQRFEAGPEMETTRPGHIRNYGNWSEQVRRDKTGFDKLYPEDFATANRMGLNAFRNSIEWARLFPRADMTTPDPAAIAYYKAMIAEMKKQHITPFMTLFHYVAPAWFFEADAKGKKGWERSDAMQHWQRFVDAVADNFIPDVEQWCTLNEPMVYVYSGYIDGLYPPLERRKDLEATAGVLEGLLQAHAMAYQTLHRVAAERHAKVNVGITQAMEAFEPLRNWAPLDRITNDLVSQGWNWDFLDAIQSGRLKMANTSVDRPITGLQGTQDYVGVNYYMRVFVKSDVTDPTNPIIVMRDPAQPNAIVNDMGWQYYPHGLYNILTQSYQRYKKPVFILENGTADRADDDVDRQRYIVAHAREVWLAIHQGGADVRAYMQWSLFDNFEWVNGFDAKFGLETVDYEHDFKRTPRKSAALYSEIAHANGVSAAMMQKYGVK